MDYFGGKREYMRKNIRYLPITFNENSLLFDSYLSLKIKDLVDIIFSHNEIIELCVSVEDDDVSYSKTIWRGHAHELPSELGEYDFIRIFGCVSESIYKSDTIYIECEPPLQYTDRLNSFQEEMSYLFGEQQGELANATREDN